MAYKLQQTYDVTIVVLSVAFEKNINDIVNIVVISCRYRLFWDNIVNFDIHTWVSQPCWNNYRLCCVMENTEIWLAAKCVKISAISTWMSFWIRMNVILTRNAGTTTVLPGETRIHGSRVEPEKNYWFQINKNLPLFDRAMICSNNSMLWRRPTASLFRKPLAVCV